MLSAVALIGVLAAQQSAVPGLNAKLELYSYLPGQREVVLGVQKTYPNVLMQVIYQADIPPSFPAGGGTVTPGGLSEKTLGFVQWSIKDDKFGDQPCKVLKCQGQLTEKITKTLQVTIADVHQYWIDSDGKILRQFDQQLRPPNISRTANCVYQKDSIDVSVDDEKGRRATSIYPNIDMQQLHDQFKPMVVDGKVVLQEKTYYVFDPFTSQFDKYTARVAGTVGGEYFHMKFQGKAFEIEGPRLTETAGISSEGDLIKVDLPKNRYIVMAQVPPGKGG